MAIFTDGECARIMSRVDKQADDECWPWKGKIRRDGYGQINIGSIGRSMNAHRVVWAMANGRMPKSGMVIMHSCDNRFCVNSAHLSEGTMKDNSMDMVKKGRHHIPMWTKGAWQKARAKNFGHSNLTDDDVRAILARLAKGEHCDEITPDFDVGPTAISGMRSGQSWKHIKRPKMPKRSRRKTPATEIADECCRLRMLGIGPLETSHMLNLPAWKPADVVRWAVIAGRLKRELLPPIRRYKNPQLADSTAESFGSTPAFPPVPSFTAPTQPVAAKPGTVGPIVSPPRDPVV